MAELLDALDRVDAYVRSGAGASDVEAILARLATRPWLSATNLGSRLPSREEMRTQLRWRSLDLDPSPYWERLRCPVLAVFGERDEMIPVELSALRIAEACARGANENVEVRVFAGANHALQPGTQAFADVAAWVGERTGVK